MEKNKPTIARIQEYLKTYDPLDLSGASIKLISEHNHLHYQVEKDGKVYCLRMINPESYRRGEWLHIAEEYTLLKHLEFTGLGPRPYFVDPERFTLPLLIQEFVSNITCFNDLKPLNRKHLEATAQTIAFLNAQDITPEKFPFRERFTRYSYLTSVKTWRKHLARIRTSKQKDVLEWADRIEQVVNQAEKVLKGFEALLMQAPHVFNFDGAHCGNTYWKEKPERVVFLDWQKVSHGDPAFTLARFLTSIGKNGEIPAGAKELMIETYSQTPYFHRLAKRARRLKDDFGKLVDQRLFERQVADLVWMVWNYVRERRTEPVDQATSVAVRYHRVKKILEQY